jgi:hypothetical protein
VFKILRVDAELISPLPRRSFSYLHSLVSLAFLLGPRSDAAGEVPWGHTHGIVAWNDPSPHQVRGFHKGHSLSTVYNQV